MKKVERKKRNQKGFSLVELIIVIAILGIIAAIAIPNVTSALKEARTQSDITNAKAIANAVIQIEAREPKASGIVEGAAKAVTIATADGNVVVTGETHKIADELNGVIPKLAEDKTKDFYVAIEPGGNVRVYKSEVSYDGTNKTYGTTDILYPAS